VRGLVQWEPSGSFECPQCRANLYYSTTPGSRAYRCVSKRHYLGPRHYRAGLNRFGYVELQALGR